MISRYDRPMAAQYMPTTPNPQLVAMMLQKRSADEARASEARNIMESDVLGVKAYGEEHSALLQEKQTQYNDRISNIYDRYADDPNASLYAMNELNRSFKKDLTSGELYDIDYRYKMAQEDIADAKEGYSKGDYTESAFRTQVEKAGTGFRAQKNPGMFDKIDKMISSTDYSTDVFGGDDQMAVLNMQQAFQKRFSTQLSYMNKEEYDSAMSYVENAVYNKHRADNPNAGRRNIKYGSTTTPEGYIPSKNASRVTDPDSAGYGVGKLPYGMDKSVLYDENGYIKQSVKDDHARLVEAQKKQEVYDNMSFSEKLSLSDEEHNPLAYARENIINETGDIDYGYWLSKQVQDKGEIPELRTFTPEALTSAKDNYNLPVNWSDEQISEYMTGEINKNSVEFGTSYTLMPGKKNQFLPPKLVGENDKIMNLDNKVVYVDGVLTEGNEVFDMISDALVDSDLKQPSNSENGAMPVHSVDQTPGSIRYGINTSDGYKTIDVVSDNPNIVNAATAVNNIAEARSTGAVGKDKPIPGTAGIVDTGIYDADGNLSPQQYANIVIMPEFQEKDKNDKVINRLTYKHMAVDNNGEFIEIYDSKGNKGYLEVDFNKLVTTTYDIMKEHYRNPNIK